jgi:hypothetical protein
MAYLCHSALVGAQREPWEMQKVKMLIFSLLDSIPGLSLRSNLGLKLANAFGVYASLFG